MMKIKISISPSYLKINKRSVNHPMSTPSTTPLPLPLPLPLPPLPLSPLPLLQVDAISRSMDDIQGCLAQLNQHITAHSHYKQISITPKPEHFTSARIAASVLAIHVKNSNWLRESLFWDNLTLLPQILSLTVFPDRFVRLCGVRRVLSLVFHQSTSFNVSAACVSNRSIETLCELIALYGADDGCNNDNHTLVDLALRALEKIGHSCTEDFHSHVAAFPRLSTFIQVLLSYFETEDETETETTTNDYTKSQLKDRKEMAMSVLAILTRSAPGSTFDDVRRMLTDAIFNANALPILVKIAFGGGTGTGTGTGSTAQLVILNILELDQVKTRGEVHPAFLTAGKLGLLRRAPSLLLAANDAVMQKMTLLLLSRAVEYSAHPTFSKSCYNKLMKQKLEEQAVLQR